MAIKKLDYGLKKTRLKIVACLIFREEVCSVSTASLTQSQKPFDLSMNNEYKSNSIDFKCQANLC